MDDYLLSTGLDAIAYTRHMDIEPDQAVEKAINKRDAEFSAMERHRIRHAVRIDIATNQSAKLTD